MSNQREVEFLGSSSYKGGVSMEKEFLLRADSVMQCAMVLSLIFCFVCYNCSCRTVDFGIFDGSSATTEKKDDSGGVIKFLCQHFQNHTT